MACSGARRPREGRWARARPPSLQRPTLRVLCLDRGGRRDAAKQHAVAGAPRREHRLQQHRERGAVEVEPVERRHRCTPLRARAGAPRCGRLGRLTSVGRWKRSWPRTTRGVLDRAQGGGERRRRNSGGSAPFLRSQGLQIEVLYAMASLAMNGGGGGVSSRCRSVPPTDGWLGPRAAQPPVMKVSNEQCHWQG